MIYMMDNNKFNKDDAKEVSYYPADDNDVGTVKPRHSGIKAKVLGIIALMAVVSVGSIGGYKAITEKEISGGTSVSDTADTEKAEAADKTETETTVADAVDSAVTTAATDSSSYKSMLELANKGSTMTVPDIVKKVKPSVVGISSEFVIDSGYSYLSGSATGTGTGIVMSEDGYIITNAHVVVNSDYGTSIVAKKVTVVLADQSEHEAEIIGKDTKSDLAVLKIDAAGLDLTPAEFGNSDELEEGELAVAIGNPLGFELYGSTTCGIISALNRTITTDNDSMSLIQTDAAINPGNSGGPLINSYGQVIGINSNKIVSSQVEGIGFAIPINEAKPIIDDLINKGYVTGRPLIGITGEDINQRTARYYDIPEGVMVRFIEPGSAADNAGVKVGDIIVGAEGESVTTMDEINKIKENYKAGDEFKITVYRDGSELDLTLVLGEATAENQ